MANTLHWVRWLLLVPAYMAGLGIGPMILMISFNILHIDIFEDSFIFYLVGSALASIGSSILSAWTAPKAKLLVGVIGAVTTGIVGPTIFFVGRGYGSAPLLAVFLGYIGGAFLAIVLLLISKQRFQVKI